MSPMLPLYYDHARPQQAFGAARLRAALERAGVSVAAQPLHVAPRHSAAPCVVISTPFDGLVAPWEELSAEGFSIQRHGAGLHVVGHDPRGAMYGALEVADHVAVHGGLDGLDERVRHPFLNMRGIRYCLPWSVYDNGEAFTENWGPSWDIRFWRDYFDFLAEHRYNCVTLWSRHPWHYLFRLEKYPHTTPLSDAELARNTALFRGLTEYARGRGVDTFLVTWNVDVEPCAVAGLGLPPELADYSATHHLRQQSPVIKDYLKECVRTLLQVYPDLTGLGTAGAEEMVGSTEEREQWLTETYMAGIRESGRTVPFIHRTQHQTAGPIKDLWVDKYPGQSYISWKYSIAHMYSHPRPVWEELNGVWKDVDLDETRVTYTVRNDDFFTLRWGDPGYVKAYVRQMKKPYVHGFYWGASGYLWGIDFQHRDDDRKDAQYPNMKPSRKDRPGRAVTEGGHKTWTYDWERHAYEFALWGRLAYDPDLPDALWKSTVFAAYETEVREDLFEAFRAASQIIPAVNQYFWLDNHFEWFPEGCTSAFGFKTVRDFAANSPMPGCGAVKTADYVAGVLAGREIQGTPPSAYVETLRTAAQQTERLLERLRVAVPRDHVAGELKCILYDLEAWSALGAYYADKIEAAVELTFLEQSGEEPRRARAVALLRRAYQSWQRLAQVTSRHYVPYFHDAINRTFSWALLLDEVEQDVTVAERWPVASRA